MVSDKIDLINKYGEKKSNALENHLKARYGSFGKKQSFYVVYDLLNQCNLRCLGCGTNAIWTHNSSVICEEMTLRQTEKTLVKIRDYSNKIGFTPFIYFGGGEPFLRADIIALLKMSAEIMGADCVGIDTNASLANSYKLISDALPYVSYVGVSINGLETYHNWWTNNLSINAYNNATYALKQLCKDKACSSKIEVTSVATRSNCRELTSLMIILKELGISNYSVHRPIPAGRMRTRANAFMLTADEHLDLLVDLIDLSNTLSLNVHFHHSIEDIYASLLFGIDTYDTENIINNNYRSSISIDSSGEVLINPWCTVGLWRKLSLGNVFQNGFSFEKAFDDNNEVLKKVQEALKKQNRCYGCERNCSGGSRIAAAINEIEKKGIRGGNVDELIEALKARDPACPLYNQKQGE